MAQIGDHKVSVAQQLYVLRPASDSDRSFAWIDDARMKWDADQCQEFGSLPTRRLSPLTIKSRPRIRDEFIWTWFHDLMVTDAGRAKMLARRLTAFEFEKVTVSDQRPDNEDGALWELQVTGFSGFVRTEHLSVRQHCCAHGAFSFTFTSPFHTLVDISKWDGADIFTVWPFPLIRICTGRFADALRLDRLNGIKLVRIEDFRLAGGTAAPGIPSESLSEPTRLRLEADAEYVRLIQATCQSS